jgi:hypothetical protein
VPVTVVSNKISKPVGQTRLSDRLAGKCNPQWVGACWDRGSRTVAYKAKGVAAVGTVRIVFEARRVTTYNTISFLMFRNPLQEEVRREDEGISVEESDNEPELHGTGGIYTFFHRTVCFID